MFSAVQVMEALKALIAERGEDFVYVDEHGDVDSDCMYVHYRGTPEETPGCAIGVMHFNLTGSLVPVSYEHETPTISITTKHPKGEFWGEHYTNNARTVMAEFQRHQDEGMRYGNALRLTLEYAEEEELISG